jgi:hypothetical protein
VYLEIPSPDTSLPLEDVVEPNIESDEDDRGMLLLSPRPKEDAKYSLEEDSFSLVRPEEELDASREDDEMSLDSEFGAFSMRDMAAYTVSMSSRPRRLKRLRWGFLCIRTSAGGREEKDEWSSGLGLLVAAAAVAAAAAAVVNSEELAEVQVETVTKPPMVGGVAPPVPPLEPPSSVLLLSSPSNSALEYSVTLKNSSLQSTNRPSTLAIANATAQLAKMNL